MSLDPFAWVVPTSSSMATGYVIADDGSRIDTSAADAEKRRRQVAAVMKTVGIVTPETKEDT
jgi:hypothetical protein